MMTVGQKELDPATHEAIKTHSAKGDRLAAAKAFDEAVAEYNKAWVLVPNPKNGWNAPTWILAAIADAAFLAGYKTSAREALQYAVTSAQERLGTRSCTSAMARFCLMLASLTRPPTNSCAYMAEVAEIFAAEDPRYLDFLKTRAKL